MFEILNIDSDGKKELVKIINPKDELARRHRFDGYSLEHVLERLGENSTVLGYILARESDDMIIKTNFDSAGSSSVESMSVNALTDGVLKLVKASRRVVKELNPWNELDYLRVNTRKYEIMAAKVDAYVLTVVQLNTRTLK